MSTKAPKISVVIPTWNRADWLPEAIRSAAGFHEVLVVDDGSTDHTAERIREFPNVQWHFAPHRGPAAARNLGIAHASGDFVWFLDSDDQFTKEAKVLAHRLIREHDLILIRSNARSREFNTRSWASLLEAAQEELPLQSGCFLVRRSLLQDVGGFADTYTNAEDLDLALRLGDRPCLVVESPSLFHTGSPPDQRTLDPQHTAAGMRWLLEREAKSAYPGDPNLRRELLAKALRSTSRALVGQPEGWELYLLGLDLQRGAQRWRYLAGYPALFAARRILK